MRFSESYGFGLPQNIFNSGCVCVINIYYKTLNKLHKQLLHFQLHRWNIFRLFNIGRYVHTRWMYLWKCSKLYKKWKCQNVQNFLVIGNKKKRKLRKIFILMFSQTIWCSATCFNDGYMNFDCNNFSFYLTLMQIIFTLHSVHWERHKSISW